MQPDVRAARLAHWPDMCIQMFEQNRAVTLLIDPDDGQILDANEAACAYYGYSRERLRAMTVEEITAVALEEGASAYIQALLEASDYVPCRHRLASDEIRDVEVLSSPLQTADGPLLYAAVHDITERRRAEQALEHQALHDPVTGLPNRMLLHDRLSQVLLRAQRVRTPVALLLMDLDRFKEINDTFGHHYGDQVLEQVGRRLAHSLRQSDTVARLGGDEFAVVLPDTSEAGAARAAQKLLDALAEPFSVDGHALQVEASVGIALDLEQSADRTTLLRQADVAMYVAKRTSSGWAVYRPEDDLHSPRRLTLVGDLRRAIEAGALCLHYQPKLALGTGQVTGVEALVRWPHPERGMIPPDEFIGLAEATGLIRPLTLWVLNEALSQCRRWREAGLEIAVAVNLSPRSLQDRDLVTMVQEHLKRWDANPEWLELEITEGAIMADADRALETLVRLHDMGVKISIDDFGTGYSSLAYLRNLPLDEIKIDKSFILGMARNEDDAFIPQSVIDLGHNLGMQVVAEGVETQRILERLAAMGCDQAQGYHLSRPLPAAEIERWLDAGLAQSA